MTEAQNMKVKKDRNLCEETRKLRTRFEESRKIDSVSKRISRFSERKDGNADERQ